jgi:hypothetical protein
MSLAMYAAPFDDENTQVNNKDNDSPIARKRQANNRTQKRVPKEHNYSEKVNSVLQSIHNLPEQSSGLADFTPLPPPTSVGVEQTRIRESELQEQNAKIDEGYTLENTGNFNRSEQNSQEDYYKRFMPNYDKMYKNSPNNMPYYSGYNANNTVLQMTGENSILIEKLNYMIHLLEEQQDERTGNVTEEVILYCFLGIFIIFVIDSFVRVGKYVR